MIKKLLLILLLLPTSLKAKCFDPKKTYEVIIVGAGISGLAAADTLKKNGVEDVLILEANNRIGGRIWTTDPWGSKLELGASWIHGIESNPVFDIVEHLNVSILPTAYNANCITCQLNSMVIYDANGQRLSKQTMNELRDDLEQFEKYIETLNTKKRPHTLSYLEAFNSFAEEKKLSKEQYNRLYFVIRLTNTYEFSADLENMSIAIEHSYSATKASGTNAIIPLGYSLVTDKLAKNLSLLLNCHVYEIAYNDQGVQLKTAKGEFHAKRCIITVPLGVLKHNIINFLPPLPQKKQEAIANLGIGIYNKIYLFYPCVFWDKSAEWIELMPPQKEHNRIFGILNLNLYLNQPILCGFTAGSFGKEVEQWSDQDTIHTFQETLKKMYGEAIPEPSAYIVD